MPQKKAKHATTHATHKAKSSHDSAPSSSAKKSATNTWGFAQPNLFGKNPLSDMMSQGVKAFSGGFSGRAEEAKKIHERALEFSREGAEKFARGADSAAQKLNEAVEIGKENFEALVESANIASKVAKHIGAEISEYTNNRVTENFRAFEEFLGCKTVSDFLNLHSNLIKSNVDAAFNESLKISELLMEMGKAAEPVAEQVSSATEKWKKAAAA